MKAMKKLAVTISFLGIVIGATVSAQFIPDPVSLIPSPQSPNPGSQITVRASTPTFDKNTANFEWVIGGRARPELSGLGKNAISLTVGDVGTVTQVKVNITRVGGNSGGSASVDIRPADLALTWFAETYVPRWYKGKALPTQNSIVNIVAVPQMSIGTIALKTQDLIFNWSVDDTVNAQSGIGKNVLRLRVSDLPENTHHIRVKVRDPQGRIAKDGEIFIVSGKPRAVLYAVSPLGGVESRSAPLTLLQNIRGTFDFIVEPYFFPDRSRYSFAYTWSVAGGAARGTPEKPFLLSLNTGSEPIGVVPISVSIKAKEEYISPVVKAITLLLQ